MSNPTWNVEDVIDVHYDPTSQGSSGDGGPVDSVVFGCPDNLPQLVDDHDELSQPDIDELLKDMNDVLSDEEKEDVREVIENNCENDDGSPDGEEKEKNSGEKADQKPGGKQAGHGAGGVWTFADVKSKVKRKKKWETVIKKWAVRKMSMQHQETEQWARINRRFAGVEDQLGDLSIPTEMEIEDMCWENDRIEVWFFQDTSGSCVHLVDRFFKAARSLPPDKFQIRLFAFNDYVYEASMDTGKLNIGGGTNFAILEAKIQELIKTEGIKYPQAVFIISDGYGTPVNPQLPARWFWFLSEHYTQCIPSTCNIFKLSDFE